MARINWTDEELKAAVEVYLEMLSHQRSGESFVKKRYYEDLHARFGRTVKSYEYRMQNISFVLASQGRKWLTGLVPAQNVGVNVATKLENILAEIEGQSFGGAARLAAEVNHANKSAKKSKKPKGNPKPKGKEVTSTQYVRDPEVISWVLNEAQGTCERCDADAPFVREDGTPYLEVHHVTRLADKGPDTIKNAVAICPNCHRELHYGAEKAAKAIELVEKVTRLNRFV